MPTRAEGFAAGRLAGIVVVGGREVSEALIAAGPEAQARAHAITLDYGNRLKAEVQRRASGRPGPNVITGQYRASIRKRTTKAGGNSSVEVGTDAPQGRRLEWGFHGIDSMGRHYNQPPFPHFDPALQTIGPEYARALDAVVAFL